MGECGEALKRFQLPKFGFASVKEQPCKEEIVEEDECIGGDIDCYRLARKLAI
jgi:hypothetical protein